MNDITTKIKEIRNSFVRNINLEWHFDSERNTYVISNIAISKVDIEFVMYSLLCDKNNYVLLNALRFFEFLIKNNDSIDHLLVNKVIEMFNEGSNEVSSQIIHLFTATISITKKYLLKIIEKSQELPLRNNSIILYGEVRQYDSQISQLLIKALIEEENTEIRIAIVKAISKTKDFDALDSLLISLEKDSSEIVRADSAFALGEIRSPESIQPLIKSLDDISELVKEKAAEALGKLGFKEKEVTNKLLEILQNNNNSPILRKEAAWALAKFSECEIIPIMIENMNNSFDYEVREAAMNIIDYLQTKCKNTDEALSHLVDLKKNDPESNIRLLATKVLKEMCKKKGLNLNECIENIDPYVDKKNQFWINRKISEIEEYFDKIKINKIEDLIIIGINYLTSEKGFDSIKLIDLYGIFLLLDLKIPNNQINNEFDKLVENDIITKFMDGFRLTVKGREKKKNLMDQEISIENKGIMTATSGHFTEITLIDKTAFIAYSWDNEEHKKWVKKLADQLMENGVYTIFDQYSIRYGFSIPNFMNKIDEVDYILVVCTSNYNEQLKKMDSGTHYEGTIIGGKITEGFPRERIIPIYREGRKISPPFLKGILGVNMKKDEDFELEFKKLLKHIYGKDGIKPPPLGSPPNLED